MSKVTATVQRKVKNGADEYAVTLRITEMLSQEEADEALEDLMEASGQRLLIPSSKKKRKNEQTKEDELK